MATKAAPTLAAYSIPLSDIIVSQLEPQIKRRSHFKAPDIAELAESIRDKGLISPITVRPLGKKYELIAGERRFLAHQHLKLKSIDAIVRELTDEAAVEVQLHENLKRLEVEPLDEAFSYQYLIEHAQVNDAGTLRPYTVKDIAAKFAKSEEIILRRLKLVDLCDEGKKDLADGVLPLAHAELLARFPEKTQTKLLKDNVYNYSWQAKTKLEAGTVTIGVLQEAVTSNNVSRSLRGAKFDTKDASLHKEGLICADCTKRTGFSPMLFTDTAIGKKDSCLDGACWDSKLRAMLTQKREKLAGELPNPKELSLKDLSLLVPMVKGPDAWRHEHRDVLIGKGVYLRNTYQKEMYREAQKGECEFVEKALRIGGNGIGATTFICRSKDCEIHKAKKQPSGYDYEGEQLKRQEHNLNASIADAVRMPLIVKKAETFNEAAWIFDTPEGKKELLVVILDDCSDVWGELRKWEGWPQEFNSGYGIKAADIRKWVDSLKPDVLSQVFALVVLTQLGSSDRSELADQTPIRNLAEEFGENYDLLDAKARVELIPETHKEAAEAHLAAVEAGKKSKPPTVFWPRPKVEKAKAKASESVEA